MLTNERAEQIASYLMNNKEYAEELLQLSPEEAVKKMNEEGNDFTAEEIIEFGENLKTASVKNEELDENALEDVSGGSISIVAAGVCLTCFSAGYLAGKDAANNWKW